MFTWIANFCGYLLDLVCVAWRALFDNGPVKRWWYSHYK